MCFGCSKEPSHGDGSFEYPQHMFRMRNNENNFPRRTLIWRPGNFRVIMWFKQILIVRICIGRIHTNCCDIRR